VVWVPWDRKGPGSYFKVPYLRWFLTYFVTYHVNKSLDALNRHLHALAALSDRHKATAGGRWGLVFQTFLHLLLLVVGLCLAVLTLVFFMSWNI
jgi:hypothetical protein